MKAITVWRDTEPGPINPAWIVSLDDEMSSDTLEVCESESEALNLAKIEAAKRGLTITLA